MTILLNYLFALRLTVFLLALRLALGLALGAAGALNAGIALAVLR